MTQIKIQGGNQSATFRLQKLVEPQVVTVAAAAPNPDPLLLTRVDRSAPENWLSFYNLTHVGPITRSYDAGGTPVDDPDFHEYSIPIDIGTESYGQLFPDTWRNNCVALEIYLVQKIAAEATQKVSAFLSCMTGDSGAYLSNTNYEEFGYQSQYINYSLNTLPPGELPRFDYVLAYTSLFRSWEEYLSGGWPDDVNPWDRWLIDLYINWGSAPASEDQAVALKIYSIEKNTAALEYAG